MVSYKKLGLVNTKKMFAKAVKGGYAIPAFNFNTMEQMQAIVQAAVETKSPVIMQVSKGARKYANPTILRYMAEGASSTRRSSAARSRRSSSTSTTATASRRARAASTRASRPS